MKKDLNGNSISLILRNINGGYTITAISDDPKALFSNYDSDVTELKRELENLCDEYIEELGHDIHTSFTQPDFSFLSTEIKIIREYSI